MFAFCLRFERVNSLSIVDCILCNIPVISFSIHRKSAQCAILTGCIQCGTFGQHGDGHGQHGALVVAIVRSSLDPDPRQIAFDEFDVCFLCLLGSC